MQARLDLRNLLQNKKNGIAFRHVKQKDRHELLKDKNDCILIESDETLNNMRGGVLPVRNIIRQSVLKKLYLYAGILLRLF